MAVLTPGTVQFLEEDIPEFVRERGRPNTRGASHPNNSPQKAPPIESEEFPRPPKRRLLLRRLIEIGGKDFWKKAANDWCHVGSNKVAGSWEGFICWDWAMGI